jgi:hypothetical protein
LTAYFGVNFSSSTIFGGVHSRKNGGYACCCRWSNWLSISRL